MKPGPRKSLLDESQFSILKSKFKSLPLGFSGDGMGDVSAFTLFNNRRIVCLTPSSSAVPCVCGKPISRTGFESALAFEKHVVIAV